MTRHECQDKQSKTSQWFILIMSIHMYCCNLNTMDNGWHFYETLELLPPYRRAKIDDLYFEKDKKMSILTWLLLKYAMFYEGVQDFESLIAFGKHGKPLLSNSNGIYFNLSHSNSMAFCVISNSDVGCDVEFAHSFDWRLVSKLYFTEEENVYLQKADNSDEFFKIWTLKESFTKFTGDGLYMPLNSFNISVNQEQISINHTFDNPKCYFYYSKSIDGYHYACCSNNEISPEIKICGLDAHALL